MSACIIRVLEIVEQAHQEGTLDTVGVWSWQQLPSGVWWLLSKWVRVNTVAPFTRAAKLISKCS
ncbi:hypothetical protein FJ366_01080 [Candidatus Dependentiae bacterium]|nr:hypothetical protein [Candidatus Dependentiae bacterium]